MFSREAFRLCVRGLRRTLEDPKDVSARGDVLLGAALGGLAIENSMLGAAHAAANPLSARFGVVHGQAIGLMLPAVVRFNAHEPEARDIYQQLALQAGLVEAGQNGSSGAMALADFLTNFRRRAGLPGSLAAVSVQPADLEPLADDAVRQWTAGFNPRPVTAADFVDLYRSALECGDSEET
jgi:alcohol dehydrogenase